jgi:hypothetical protein
VLLDNTPPSKEMIEKLEGEEAEEEVIPVIINNAVSDSTPTEEMDTA